MLYQYIGKGEGTRSQEGNSSMMHKRHTPTRRVSGESMYNEDVIGGNTMLRPQATYRRTVSIYSKVVGRNEG